MFQRTRAAVAVLAMAATAAAVVTSAASAEARTPTYTPPPCPSTAGVSRVAVQPTDSGNLRVAHVAAAKAGAADKWDLKADLWFCNRSATNFGYVATKIEFLDATGAVTKTVTTVPWTYPDQDNNLYLYTLPANTTSPTPAFVRPGEPYGRAPVVFDYPLPAHIRFTTTFQVNDFTTTGSATDTVTVPVGDQVSPGPVQGFFFPESQSSLPAGAYYFQTYHDDMNLHNRYALDIMAQRWDATAGAWTPYKPYNAANPTDPANDHHNPQSWIMWGNTVRAMSDGEVISCVRGSVDNKPYIIDGKTDATVKGAQVVDHAGGNYLWIRTGNQTQVYAHLQYKSIPYNLCPFDDTAEHQLANPYLDVPGDAKYQVKAGQVLGIVGNSGNTSNPHTHVESILGTSSIWGGQDAEFGYGSDSRPMNFVNVKVQPVVSTSPASASAWNEVTSARVIPSNSLISPNACGYVPSTYAGKAEVVLPNVAPNCWAQLFNAMVQAGFRPTHLDSNGVGSTRTITSVWRPVDGTPWVAYDNLSVSQLQTAANKYTTNGWRYLDLESYVVGGVLRYDAIFVRQPGAAQYARVGLTAAGYSSVANTERNAGYRLIDYSVAVVGAAPGTRYYSGLWIHAPAVPVASYVVEDVAAANYQTEFNTQTAAGRMPVSLDSYTYNGTTYLSTVWWNSQNVWGAAHGLSASQVTTNEASNLASGRYARGATQYGVVGAAPYAAVWRAAPNTAITAGPAAGSSTSATTAAFAFKVTNDASSTFECRLDASAWVTCASATYSGLTVGSHTFSVRARDFEGLRDPTPATRAWTVTP